MKKVIQFIAGKQKPVTKTINWKTRRINKLRPKAKAISPREQKLIDKGLLHINVHHPKCKHLIHH